MKHSEPNQQNLVADDEADAHALRCHDCGRFFATQKAKRAHQGAHGEEPGHEQTQLGEVTGR
jgi:hypothetical protein